MSHLDHYLDRCPGFGYQGAPSFNTLIVPLRNKRDRRNAEWSQPEWSFSLPFNNNFPEYYEQVMDTFLVCRAQAHAFRVRNRLFYRADNWLFGYGNGVDDEFQLGRLIEIAGESFLHQIHALSLDDEAPTPAATASGVSAPAIFNNRTGKIRFNAVPANGAPLRWSGWFDFWVRFAADDLPATIDDKSHGEDVLNYQVDLVETYPPAEAWT